VWVFVEKRTGKILVAGKGGCGPLSNFDLFQGEPVEIPEQDLSRLYTQPKEGMPRSLRSDVFYPRDVTQFTSEEMAVRADAKTDAAIGATLHPSSPRGEEAAIHREQLQAILDKLGMKPTEKFKALMEIAGKAVAEGQQEKATVAKAG
jgi:hypothetical protein